MKTVLHFSVSLAAGVLIGVFLHYVLYRISVSGAPFIYFAF